MPTTEPAAVDLSIVVPIYNEEGNIQALHRRVTETMDQLGLPWEFILVDDGSRDASPRLLEHLAAVDPRVRVVRLRRNFGQSAALAAGFENARGRIIITMDGDLQNDPADIPFLLEKLEEGFDVVSGWRRHRKDKLLIRKVPSWLANRLICSVTGVRLHDTGCALKAYRREIIDRIRLYGELHRFIPALSRLEEGRIAEVPVRHHPRVAGKSKYNITRTYKVIMDLFTLSLLLKYERNPLHFFGKLAAVCLLAALGFGVAMATKLTSGSPDASELNILASLVFLLLAAAMQFVLLGLVGKLIVALGDRPVPYRVVRRR
ncbi:MAG: glycosyltransferase family 2 protein [candidate division KSB1 bacterium]|nr:glycosyltransferase family 2 protein [candidate division KSB1 bacterium]